MFGTIVEYDIIMMKFISGFIVLFLSNAVLSQSKVVADFSNLESNKGVCRVCLFNNAASFKGETGEPFRCIAVPVKNLTAQAVFQDVPAGTYAMFVFHDENSNSKLDKNFLGIPKEGYGASNNKLPFAGAPTFEANKFTVDGKTAVNMKVKIRNL
jgi:uncharacterized protein (DUF2141 family)